MSASYAERRARTNEGTYWTRDRLLWTRYGSITAINCGDWDMNEVYVNISSGWFYTKNKAGTQVLFVTSSNDTVAKSSYSVQDLDNSKRFRKLTDLEVLVRGLDQVRNG